MLRLYVTGTTARSARAIANARRACETYLSGRYDLAVVDIYQHPEAAQEHQIIAAPTLVRLLPMPLRRLVGDLSDNERVLAGTRDRDSGEVALRTVCRRVNDQDIIAGLRHQLADAGDRLREATDTIEAIRSGDVDAVVVGGAAGPKMLYAGK